VNVQIPQMLSATPRRDSQCNCNLCNRRRHGRPIGSAESRAAVLNPGLMQALDLKQGSATSNIVSVAIQ
jgi:hypothetical protein